jgi:predicted secreted protein
MPQILERKPFYSNENSDLTYQEILATLHGEAIATTTHSKKPIQSIENPEKSLRGAISSTEYIADQLPECDKRNFQITSIAMIYLRSFAVEILAKHCKIYFFCKENKENISIGKGISMWSDTRRDASVMANYWVDYFNDKIIQDEAMREAMNPLRSESKNKPESLYVMISCVSMILAGAKEQDPLSPVLAISKIYHEYLYYINSVVDNKHGVEANSENYQTKVRDYMLASNLVLGKLKQYIDELQITQFLNPSQHRLIVDLFDELNGDMMGVFKKDYGSGVEQYFDKNLQPQEQEIALVYWTDHAVNMTGKWTEFFAIIGAVAANEGYENTNCNSETIKAFGKIWGYGQLINGFKDFVVIDSVADDIREKRCTPQILHLLFQSSTNPDNSDYDWIKSTVESTSNANTDLTPEHKTRFVQLFQKYETVEFIRQKCEKAIDSFWQVYDNDALLQNSLKERGMDFKMRAMINGGLVSFFEQSRYLPK